MRRLPIALRRLPIALLTALAIALAGCAGTASRPPSPTPAPTPTTAPPSPTPTPSQSSLAVATKEFCRTTIEHSSEGLDAILKLVEHPDGKGLDTTDFSDPQTKLIADEKLAPADLKKYLHKQITVLGTIVDVFEGEGNDTIDTGGYRDASAGFVLACGEQIESTEEPEPEPTEAETPWQPSTEVDWENYAPAVKTRIDRMGRKGDCEGLQEEFDTAYENDEPQRSRVGDDGNADLMEYIQEWLDYSEC